MCGQAKGSEPTSRKRVRALLPQAKLSVRHRLRREGGGKESEQQQQSAVYSTNTYHNLIIHQINQSKEKREQTTRKRNVISPRNMALSLSFLHTKLPNPHHHHLSSTQTHT
ncbi:hypothetical protein VTJ04DRAFT_8931 [Mycothermus thermophilus]|uniref:uncharacterized protein n=1 Tax=Humicola insolens TaxID=85995 RepID=UPI00374357F6